MKTVYIIWFLVATFPLSSLGEKACSEEIIDHKSELSLVSCKDYFLVEKFTPFSGKGSPTIRKDFLTSYFKQKPEENGRDQYAELLAVHKEIKRLSTSEAEILVPLDSPFYDLESSYHGRIAEVRIYQGASAVNKEGIRWLKDAYKLHKKMHISIVEQIAPNKSKQ